MNLSIEIRQLGPIRDTTIHLKPLTVITGESGLGKSYAALACLYLFDILSGTRLGDFLIARIGSDLGRIHESVPNGQVLFSLTYREVLDWCHEDVKNYLAYMTGNPELQADIDFHLPIDEGHSFDFSVSVSEQVIDEKPMVIRQLSCNDAYFSLPPGTGPLASIYYSTVLASALRNLVFGESVIPPSETIVLPPSRGALMDCVSRPKFKSGIYDRFFDFKENLLRGYYHLGAGQSDSRQIINVIGGTLRLADGEVFYRIASDRSIPLSATASSIKELAPYLLWTSSPISFGAFILFEEPEAHLHPSRQVKLADTFGFTLGDWNWILLTTHSDYLLKRINQLGRLQSIINDNPEAATQIMNDHGIDRNSLISFESIAAYLMEADAEHVSTMRDIMTPDGIKFATFANVIDSEFDLSYDIEQVVDSDNCNIPDKKS